MERAVKSKVLPSQVMCCVGVSMDLGEMIKECRRKWDVRVVLAKVRSVEEVERIRMSS